MRIFHGFDHLPAFRRPAVTVGSYDGVHGGHLRLIDTVIRMAQAQGGESIVLTFDPHPRVTLGCAEGLRLLTSTEEKALLLEQAGIDNLIIIPFDKTFSHLTPDEFIRDYLIRKLGIATLVVGYNHRFGRNNLGSYDYLAHLRDELNFEIVRVAEFDADSEKVSSTVIRRLIEQGEVAHAARMMPHPYLLAGDSDGRRIHITELLKLLPPAGNYPVRVGNTAMTLQITPDGTLTTDQKLPAGKVVITFEP